MLALFPMASTIKSLRLLADPIRIRLLILLVDNELSVAELQEILGMGQSRISSHLSQLKAGGLVQVRRSGKRMLYSGCAPEKDGGRLLAEILEVGRQEIAAVHSDSDGLELILRKRTDHSRAYFDQLAGKFGRAYCPGRSWQGLAETLLKLMPPLVIADLGSGEGTFSLLLAQKAHRVIAVDNSEKMIAFASAVAKEHGAGNLEFRLGDIEAPPIADEDVDVAFFSQALHHATRPQKAIEEACRILKPGGRIVILDLLKHTYEQARDLYADVWLGFSEVEVLGFLKKSGFTNIEVSVVHKEEQHPYFQTLLAIGEKS
jgi:ArsR family transcriptional regulator